MSRRAVTSIFAAALATAAVVATSFGLVSALPQPTQDDRIAVRLLQYLEDMRGRGSRISIGGQTLLARCTSLAPRRKLITLSDGTRLVLSGARIRSWRSTRSLLATAQPYAGLVRAAVADLAGSYALYATELSRPLSYGHDIVAEEVPGSSRTYRIVLARRPSVELTIDRASMRPLSVRFRSARVSASASLLPPAPISGRKSC